jgi:lysophospholipase L1-like esterase
MARHALAALFFALALVACSEDDTSPAPSDAGADTSTDASPDVSNDSPTTDTTTDAPAADTASEAAVDALPDAPPPEPAIHFVGRHESNGPDAARFGWPGTGFLFRFEGTAASVQMNDPSGYFTVIVDGQEQPRLETSQGEKTYALASGLTDGVHTVEVYRRAEGFFGPTSVSSIDITGTLLAPPIPNRRIEILGDSISCGYGNEGPDQNCNFSADTENHYHTYGAIAARELGAELSTIAWSGKGVIFNYGDDKDEPLPTLFERTIPSESGSSWSFAWQPDAVLINLGTNDFSTDDDPTESQFVGAYVAMLEDIRGVYPNARILCTVAPLLSAADRTLVMGTIQDAIDARAASGDSNVKRIDLDVDAIGWGCDWHPSIATHEAMAALLVSSLRSELGW